MWLDSLAIHEMQASGTDTLVSRTDALDIWIKFFQHALKQGHHMLARNTLLRIMGRNEGLNGSFFFYYLNKFNTMFC
jgi:hypothetical protein